MSKIITIDGSTTWDPHRNGAPSVVLPRGTSEWRKRRPRRGGYSHPLRVHGPATLTPGGGQSWRGRGKFRVIPPGGER
jgi:hypothetical protein